MLLLAGKIEFFININLNCFICNLKKKIEFKSQKRFKEKFPLGFWIFEKLTSINSEFYIHL